MRRYLPDTTPLRAYLQNRHAAIEVIRPWIVQREAATSILIYAEIVEYLKGLTDFPRRHSHRRDLLSEITPYFLTYGILERYADIRRRLRRPMGLG
jgi:hypothetical protein